MHCETSRKREVVKLIRMRLLARMDLAEALAETRGYMRKTLAELHEILSRTTPLPN